MPAERRVVIEQRVQNSGELPEACGEIAVWIEWLVSREHWATLAERLCVRREGGFVGTDIVLFLLMFFTMGVRQSLKQFGEWSRPCRRALAALGGRREFATPSSVSRFLGAVQEADIRGLKRWLLTTACEPTPLLRHPAVASYDADGLPWHVFDWDGTSTALRHRGLPLGADLPEPARRSANTGNPGYMGRKRGEIRFSRGTLQHAGSGLWLDVVMTSDRSDTAALLPSALDAIEETCRSAELARERVVLRADGCGGNVPFITACQQRGVPFLVRSAHYGLLEEAAIVDALCRATWYEVPDSGSGPKRLAAELGEVLLQPSKNTIDSDGKQFQPVRVRMVVSRFATEAKAGTGAHINGWQYELYATDLSAYVWPAPETVELYYGRCGQENRFAQEDRELGLDRIFSYHLPGQELATVIGLFLWNLRTTRGFAQQSPPERTPARIARRPVIGEPLRVAHVLQVEPSDLTTDAQLPPMNVPEIEEQPIITPDLAAQVALFNEPLSITDAEPPNQESKALLPQLLPQLPWSDIVADLPPGWGRTDDDSLRCHAGALLPARAIVLSRQGRAPRINFVANLSSCRSCDAAHRCVDAVATGSAKKVSRAIPVELAQALQPLLADKESKRERRQRGATPALAREPTRIAAPTSLLQLSSAVSAGAFAVVPPLLLPAVLRRTAQEAFAQLTVCVQIDEPTRLTRHPALADSADQRQNRRLTWKQRHERNALGSNATVSIQFGLPGVDSQHLMRHLSHPTMCIRAA